MLCRLLLSTYLSISSEKAADAGPKRKSGDPVVICGVICGRERKVICHLRKKLTVKRGNLSKATKALYAREARGGVSTIMTLIDFYF